MANDSDIFLEDSEIVGAEFLRKRITELRMKKDVSEYKMSYDLGHSRNYIRSITSGVAMPKMSQFYRICEYLEVTPQEFFDPDLHNPSLLNQATQLLKQLNDGELSDIIRIVERILQNRDN